MITTSTVCGKKLDIQGQDMLTLADYSSEEIIGLVEKAYEMKQTDHQAEEPLKGKILGMIFEKSSTRTRVSFEAGMLQLGGHALYLNSNDMQIGRGETIADTAKVLSNYVDGIMIRTFSHDIIEELATHATIPVINGLTDQYHPCQALADLLTIKEVKGQLAGISCVYVGDGNNVAHSLMIAAAKVGMHMTIACPKGYEPDEKVVALAQGFAEVTGSKILVENDVKKAVDDADVIYTDVWTSMGQEEENEMRLQVFHDYQVNESLVACAKEDYLFLHCLPAHRGEEVSASVIDGDHSAVFQQAGNRLHAQKALLTELL
ncbi:ornithine carbamoyltransferase [Cytobacillus sp. FSL R5-0569]|uniref:ornithine carbamoyltransferase n=1 Tax=Cytobacillus TaxID=2675230 RepID=UPI0027866924|nr:ornithine carbamoyltransferase [Cytobacillus kochii]MDQ0187025.1 ornithine carbamoyltransferase [Cytobacillus kochii]